MKQKVQKMFVLIFLLGFKLKIKSLLLTANVLFWCGTTTTSLSLLIHAGWVYVCGWPSRNKQNKVHMSKTALFSSPLEQQACWIHPVSCLHTLLLSSTPRSSWPKTVMVSCGQVVTLCPALIQGCQYIIKQRHILWKLRTHQRHDLHRPRSLRGAGLSMQSLIFHPLQCLPESSENICPLSFQLFSFFLSLHFPLFSLASPPTQLCRLNNGPRANCITDTRTLSPVSAPTPYPAQCYLTRNTKQSSASREHINQCRAKYSLDKWHSRCRSRPRKALKQQVCWSQVLPDRLSLLIPLTKVQQRNQRIWPNILFRQCNLLH